MNGFSLCHADRHRCLELDRGPEYKGDILSEPWITLNPVFLAIVTVAFVGIIVFIVRAERKKAQT